MVNRSREFELAVYDFAKALNPNAEVFFDHKVIDRDTGTFRQVDVWIQTKIAGHWPISVLVSCKLQKRTVNVSQIGTFCNEVSSTGAGFGVIYSNAKFTKSALEKARKNGLACCRLYRNEPADKPETLYFRSYLTKTAFRLTLPDCLPFDGLSTWNDLFDLRVHHGCESATVLDSIEKQFLAQEQLAITATRNALQFPEGWRCEHSFFDPDKAGKRFRVVVDVWWKRFRGRSEADLVNGSYCLTNGAFSGTVSGPIVDLEGAHPGPGWEEVDSSIEPKAGASMFIILHHPRVNSVLRRELGPMCLPNSATGTPAAVGQPGSIAGESPDP